MGSRSVQEQNGTERYYNEEGLSRMYLKHTRMKWFVSVSILFQLVPVLDSNSNDGGVVQNFRQRSGVQGQNPNPTSDLVSQKEVLESLFFLSS